MAVRIGSNIDSLNAQRRLGESTGLLRRAFERLSSGLRINRAGDDAAGLAIAESLNTDARVYTQSIRNLNDGVSLLNVAEGAVKELVNITLRISELAEQAPNGVYSPTQRAALDSEAQALSAEYTRIVQSTKFNDLTLLDGSVDSFRLQAGYGISESLDVAIGMITPQAVGDGTFTASAFAQIGTNFGTYRDLQVADLNGDGWTDVVAPVGGASYSVVLGNGDGTFKAPTSYATPLSPRTFALADTNGDGKLDLVGSGNSFSAVYVSLGTGTGTFGTATSYASVGLNSLQMADINGDGKLDVIGVDDGTDLLEVHLGNGNGTFRAQMSFVGPVGGSNSIDLDFGDFNRDGKLDVAVSNTGPGGVDIFFGNGNGTFSLGTTNPGASTFPIEVEDVNNDGIVDLVTGGSSSADVRIGNGDGTFRAPISYVASSFSSAAELRLVDLNGDSKLDIVGTSRTSGRVEIVLGNGDGSFRAPTSYNLGTTVDDIALADFTGDGVVDIAVHVAGASGGDGIQFLNANTTVAAKLPTINLRTQVGALEALTLMETSRRQLAGTLSTIGAYQSRIQVGISNLDTRRENIRAAESQIRDADIAQESADLGLSQIRQQAASSILAQANQVPAIALRLLQV